MEYLSTMNLTKSQVDGVRLYNDHDFRIFRNKNY